MTRSHRAAHPVIWALVVFVCATVIALAWTARPAPVPATLPDDAAAAVDGGG